ncbi:hypothetical protein ACTA71_004811 [Dictyostelium dimigraforme]
MNTILFGRSHSPFISNLGLPEEFDDEIKDNDDGYDSSNKKSERNKPIRQNEKLALAPFFLSTIEGLEPKFAKIDVNPLTIKNAVSTGTANITGSTVNTNDDNENNGNITLQKEFQVGNNNNNNNGIKTSTTVTTIISGLFGLNDSNRNIFASSTPTLLAKIIFENELIFSFYVAENCKHKVILEYRYQFITQGKVRVERFIGVREKLEIEKRLKERNNNNNKTINNNGNKTINNVSNNGGGGNKYSSNNRIVNKVNNDNKVTGIINGGNNKNNVETVTRIDNRVKDLEVIDERNLLREKFTEIIVVEFPETVVPVRRGFDMEIKIIPDSKHAQCR